MKKIVLTLFAGAMAFTAYAQSSISSIIDEQQAVTQQNATGEHFDEVWSRRTYWNIGYATSDLDPQEDILTGIGTQQVQKFSSDWGVSVKHGKNYRLHKYPIVNTFQFYLDFNYIDLNVSHFKMEGTGKGDIYDSRQKWASGNSKYFYMPWNLSKYEANYGMALGPSVTFAPLTSVSAPWAHFFKINVYYHIGYHASGLYMLNEEDGDVNQETLGSDFQKNDFETIKDNTKIMWGHGLTQAIGFNVSWKAIGLGYEHRSSTVKYKPISSHDFGSDTYKFDTGTNRIYLQIRL